MNAEVDRLKAQSLRLNAEIDRLNTLLNHQEQTPTLVDIRIHIPHEPPHHVTEIVAGGAAHQSGKVAVGDSIMSLAVGHIHVSHLPIETIHKNVLGTPLKRDRRDENEESRFFTMTNQGLRNCTYVIT